MQQSPKVIWTHIHQHTLSCLRVRVEIIGPSPAGAWGLTQHRVCYICLTAGKLESLLWKLFARAAFLNLPSIFTHCVSLVARLDSYRVIFIHLTPEEYIGLGFGYLPALEIAGLVPSNPLQFAYWWRWGTVSHLMSWSEIIVFQLSDLTWLYN